jgi:GH15 family glucan-1,4-alpha-glucosidase
VILLPLALSCGVGLAPDGEVPADTGGPTDGTSVTARPDDDSGSSSTTATGCAPVATLPDAPTARTTTPFIPTSNGWSTAVYAIDARNVAVRVPPSGAPSTANQAHALVGFLDHPTKQPTPTTWSQDLLWDLYFGLRVDGTGIWLDGTPEESVGYRPGTGIVHTVARWGDVVVEADWFAPFQPGGEHDVVVVATVRNEGTVGHPVELFSLENAQPGGEGFVDGETVQLVGDAVLETRGASAMLHTPLGVPTGTAAAPAGHVYQCDPWNRMPLGLDFDCAPAVWSGDDVAVGFQWDLGTLAPGASATRGVVLSWEADGSALAKRLASFVSARSAEEILAAERADWDIWHAKESLPPSLSAEEAALYRQSTAILRMGQVREEGPGQGLLLASLPPGNWNISWPRDASYAIAALAMSGHGDEAQRALQAIVDGEAGTYAGLLGIDDYMVSVARYFGDGTEESDGATCADGSDAGPNVELDGLGLFLWALGTWAEASPGDPWLEQALPEILTGVADPLVELIDEDWALLVADSSIWERHWNDCFPNGRKHFTYSSIQGEVGLRVASDLSGDARYADAAAVLAGGLQRSAVDGGPVISFEDGQGGACAALASSPEETCHGCGPWDASVVELVNHAVVPSDGALARNTVTALVSALGVPGRPGFLRGDDGTGTTNAWPWYDDQEWVVIDLRMAEAMARIGRATGDTAWTENADRTFAWVTAVASANYGLVPELLSDGEYTAEDDADHVALGVDPGGDAQGATPMVGFGAGAWILTAHALRE